MQYGKHRQEIKLTSGASHESNQTEQNIGMSPGGNDSGVGDGSVRRRGKAGNNSKGHQRRYHEWLDKFGEVCIHYVARLRHSVKPPYVFMEQ